MRGDLLERRTRPCVSLIQHPTPASPAKRQEPVKTQEPVRFSPDIHEVPVQFGNAVRNVTISKAAHDEMNHEILKMEAYIKSEAFSRTATTALLLFANCINEATNFAENCGGGGTSPSSDWGRETRMKTNWRGYAVVSAWLIRW